MRHWLLFFDVFCDFFKSYGSKPLTLIIFLYCEVEKKTVRFDFLISPKVIRVSPRYLWSIYTNIISFCWHNFHGRNFDTRRNFDDKPTIEGFKKGSKMTLEVEKSDFLAISRVIRSISRKRVKMIHRHLF